MIEPKEENEGKEQNSNHQTKKIFSLAEAIIENQNKRNQSLWLWFLFCYFYKLYLFFFKKISYLILFVYL